MNFPRKVSRDVVAVFCVSMGFVVFYWIPSVCVWSQAGRGVWSQIDRQMDDSCYLWKHRLSHSVSLSADLRLSFFFFNSSCVLISVSHTQTDTHSQIMTHWTKFHWRINTGLYRQIKEVRHSHAEKCKHLLYVYLCMREIRRSTVGLNSWKLQLTFFSFLLLGLWCSLPMGPGNTVGRMMRLHRDWRNCPCWHSHMTMVSHTPYSTLY